MQGEDEHQPQTPRRPGRRWLAISIAIALAIVVVWLLLPRDRSTPQPVGGDEYLYSTRGFEEIDALGGARHDYPPESGIRVEEGDGGRCLRLTWRPLRNRVTTWQLCGRRLVAIHEVHDFFGNRDERTYRCGPGSTLAHGWSCTYDDTTETTFGGAVGRVRIDGEPTDHVRLGRRIEGEVQGTGTREFWLRRSDGFPIGLAGTTDDISPSPIGDVRYRERYELKLGSEPGE